MRLRTLLALAVLSATALAQTKRPMTFADLQAMKRVSAPQISPSGKWVLFSVTDVSLEKNSKTNHLWVVPLAGGKEVQLTTGSGESNGRFSPDGKSVMYSADGQIDIAPWDDAAGTLGAGHAVTSLETGADGGLWAPDSKHFLFTSSVYPDCEVPEADRPKDPEGAGAFRPLNSPANTTGFSPGERAAAEAKCNADKDAVAAKSPVKAQIFTDLLYRHWNMYFGGKHTHIFYGSVDGGVPEDITPASVVGDHEAPTFSLGGPLGYAISPDGKEIAYVTNLDKVPAESTNNDIFVLQVGAAPQTAKKVSTSPGSDDGPQYSPDGKWLAWRSQKRAGFESDKFDLIVMDRATGKMHNLSTKFDGWVDEFAWGLKSDSLFFVSADSGEEAIFRESLGGQIERFTGLGEFSSLNPTPAGNLIASRMTVNYPATIVEVPNAGWHPTYFQRDLGKHPPCPKGAICDFIIRIENVKTLADPNTALLASLDFNETESGNAQKSFWFAGANGTKVQGFLIKPPNFDPAPEEHKASPRGLGVFRPTPDSAER